MKYEVECIILFCRGLWFASVRLRILNGIILLTTEHG